ncbi:metalloregulator ArsR/SmtB family transcription factor [Bacillus sp. 1P06AnD]|uniref:DUF2087 domain-containing protein n=1 Tax=Bacillus sp. 1P06AnD TaxID=3132208 RepID=UPI0039A36C17
MQLDRLVHFHKTIGDPTRIRILSLLNQHPMHGQAIAGRLGLKPPTITHHISKLREIGLIKEKRDGNTIYFSLNQKVLESSAIAIVKLISKEEKIDWHTDDAEKYKVLTHFFSHDGRLEKMPVQRKKKLIILERIASGLEMGKVYEESEINAYLKAYNDDYALLRRELVMHQFMFREKNRYELNPPELWQV